MTQMLMNVVAEMFSSSTGFLSISEIISQQFGAHERDTAEICWKT